MPWTSLKAWTLYDGQDRQMPLWTPVWKPRPGSYMICNRCGYRVPVFGSEKAASRDDGKLCILFLASNPQTTSSLDLEEELRSLESELRGSRFRDRIVLTAGYAVRPDDLVRLLRRERPTIVHFSGHGARDGIMLRSENGAIAVSGRALARLFSNRGVQLVVLNCCFSEAQALALKKAVKAVVGTTAAVDDEAARRFTAAFYRTIGDGYTIGEAFRDAGDAVALHNLQDVFGAHGDLDQSLLSLEES